jgi:hypothetical protein
MSVDNLVDCPSITFLETPGSMNHMKNSYKADYYDS